MNQSWGKKFAWLIASTAAWQLDVTAQTSQRDRLSGFISASSGTIFRGIERNQYEASLQAGIRYQLPHSFSVGAQLSQAQFGRGTSLSDDVAFDYFLGWHRALGDDSAVQVRYSRYTYPGSNDQFVEYDYNEVLVGFEFGNAFSLSASVSDSGTDFFNGQAYGQLTWTRAMAYQTQFSAALGAVKDLGDGYANFAYWDVGLSRPIGRLMLDLRFHDSPQQRFWFRRPTADNRWVLSATLGF